MGSVNREATPLTEQALLNAYNRRIGGIGGRGIGFEEFEDGKAADRAFSQRLCP